MRMKTSDLQGAALDWAVAKCLLPDGWNDAEIILGDDTDYSTNWAQGGPLIEREGINLEHNPSRCHWIASTPAPEHRNGAVEITGPTLLIAAMRCYVASKLGDIIDIPEELK
jgi:hypothetical protein